MRKLAIGSLGLVTSTATAARITAADAAFAATTDHAAMVAVLGFQWISGTVVIGDSTVTTARAGAFVELDTTTRVKEFTSDVGNGLPIRDFWCVGTGTFICYYQCS
jgi:virulence-associated protein VapD